MKRKVMILGLTMATGLPHAVCAQDASQAYSPWNTSYTPHYGVAGAERPLMDHVPTTGGSAPAGQDISSTWRLQFTPLPAVSNANDPLTAKDIRAGFSLKLDF